MDINNPHDITFKEIFLDKERVVELIRIILSKEVDRVFNYESIENEDTDFIDENMKEFHSDLLF